MLKIHDNDRTEIKTAVAGGIIALIGIKDTTTGETFCDKKSKIIPKRSESREELVTVLSSTDKQIIVISTPDIRQDPKDIKKTGAYFLNCIG